MRFKFILSVDRQKSPLPILPVHYQYPLSCWIYKMIKTGNPEYKGWLQRKNFVAARQVFPAFTFSNFLISKRSYEIKRDRLMLLADEIEMIFSFVSQVDAEEYVDALFRNQQFSLGDKKSRVFFRLVGIKKVPREEMKESMRFKCISPLMVCRKKEDASDEVQYLTPQDDDFSSVLLQELMNHYKQNSKDSFDENRMEFNMLGDPEEQQVLLKAGTPGETRIKAYNMEFEIKAPPVLLERGYHAGFGSLNKMGFGCVEVMQEEENNSLYGL